MIFDHVYGKTIKKLQFLPREFPFKEEQAMESLDSYVRTQMEHNSSMIKQVVEGVAQIVQALGNTGEYRSFGHIRKIENAGTMNLIITV